MDYVSDSVFEEILTSVLEERFPEIEYQHTANWTWEVN